MAEKVKPGFILSHEHVDMLLDEEPDVVKRVLQALYNFSMTGRLVIDGMTGHALKLLERMAVKVAEDEERFYSSKKSSAIGGSITQLRAKMKLAGTPISIEEARNMIRNGRADSNSLQATSSNINNINKENINKENIKENIFKPPTASEVEAYAKETGKEIDAKDFVDYYQSKGWYVGNTPMKNWKAAVDRWKTLDEKKTTTAQDYEQRNYTEDQLDNGSTNDLFAQVRAARETA